jgi:prepilin-type N-terminal cleavage/methylation domain-containing protein/prepilin-type processing-associated H-X9-DG protein
VKSTRSHPVGGRTRGRGFTLIELLVVVAVISVLLAITLAAVQQARTIACRVTCGRQLQQIAMAWHGREGRYNLAFLDGHVALGEIHKGVYPDGDYRVQPFKELDSFACEMQSRIVPQGEP